jgi:hypothetical protein
MLLADSKNMVAGVYPNRCQSSRRHARLSAAIAFAIFAVVIAWPVWRCVWSAT